MRLRYAAAVLCSAALVLSGCEGRSPAQTATEPTATGSPAPGGTGATGSPTPSAPAAADPGHAVDPPGPRRERLYAPDILVTAPTPIPDAVVERIRAIQGISSVTRLAVAQVPVENTAVTVAAVDPGRFRLYTAHLVADFQEAWERVARGELALERGLRKQLPLDDEQYLRLGVEQDAPRVHVGAVVPELPHVDVVVNSSWGEELGMPAGNALLVSTDIVAPQAVQKPIQRIVGADASVQMGDAIARYGLDPGVRQTAVVVGTVAEVVGVFRYRVLGGGRIAPDPAWVRENIRTDAVPILGTVTCHKAIFPQLRAALQEVVEAGLAAEIVPEQYAGCYYPRFIAGTTKLSNHSFGLALDLNVPGNQRGTAGEIHRGVVAIFERWGFAWGGRWRWTDPMHFEMAALVDARTP